MSPIIYWNGALVHRSQASISVLDYGFLYGYGLFETMRAYGGKVFRLDRHMDRLMCSAGSLGIKVDIVELKNAVEEVLHANNLGDARVRITVSIGEGEMVPDPATCKKPTVLVLAGAYTPYPGEVYRRGYRAIISSIRRNSQSHVSRIKSSSYLESILARQEARKAGVDEAICLNERGLVAEASMSNVFLVKDGILKTPSVDSGILPGIAREAVLEIASKVGIQAIECDILPEELISADEAFLTNSLIEVMPFTLIGDKPVGSGVQGPVTAKLMTAYREAVFNELKVLGL